MKFLQKISETAKEKAGEFSQFLYRKLIEFQGRRVELNFILGHHEGPADARAVAKELVKNDVLFIELVLDTEEERKLMEKIFNAESQGILSPAADEEVMSTIREGDLGLYEILKALRGTKKKINFFELPEELKPYHKRAEAGLEKMLDSVKAGDIDEAAKLYGLYLEDFAQEIRQRDSWLIEQVQSFLDTHRFSKEHIRVGIFQGNTHTAPYQHFKKKGYQPRRKFVNAYLPETQVRYADHIALLRSKIFFPDKKIPIEKLERAFLTMAALTLIDEVLEKKGVDPSLKALLTPADFRYFLNELVHIKTKLGILDIPALTEAWLCKKLGIKELNQKTVEKLLEQAYQ